MAQNGDKRMSAGEAISEFVHDNETLIIGNYTLCMACGLVYEVVRQNKKHLTFCSQSGHVIDEVLVAGGCVDRLVTAYVLNAGGTEGGSAVARACEIQITSTRRTTRILITTRGLWQACTASALCRFSKGSFHTDLFEKRGFMGDKKYKVITCPFTGKGHCFGSGTQSGTSASFMFSGPINSATLSTGEPWEVFKQRRWPASGSLSPVKKSWNMM